MNPADPKQQLIERLQSTSNVLVTVSNNPTVDQLAACIGLTLFLNKLGKHATAVFSGKVPSTIEFLKPEATIEKNTNSLRDFIIALDKSKADKLRYKVEDKVVKIFITPYRTSLSEKDFEFSQGDFNVDVVIALGVKVKEDLDRAITAHGRILHDATVASINCGPENNNLGTINWHEADSSSLCEMVADLTDLMQPNSLDAQMATALLTGIVAETARFSNNKTTPRTMSWSAKLMAAGANQQLVASKLQQGTQQKAAEQKAEKAAADGTLEISHEDDSNKTNEADEDYLPPVAKSSDQANNKKEVDLATSTLPTDNQPEDTLPVPPPSTDTPNLPAAPTQSPPKPPAVDNQNNTSRMAFEPPSMGGTLTANSRPEDFEPTTDPLSTASNQAPLLQHSKPNMNSKTPIIDNEPITRVEKELGSAHVEQQDVANQDEQKKPKNPLDAAREAVEAAAIESSDQRLEPLMSIGAQPLSSSLHDTPNSSLPVNTPETSSVPASTTQTQSTQSASSSPVGGEVNAAMPAPMAMPAPQPNPTAPLSLTPNQTSAPVANGSAADSTPKTDLPPEQTGINKPPSSPPPVPPPMIPPF